MQEELHVPEGELPYVPRPIDSFRARGASLADILGNEKAEEIISEHREHKQAARRRSRLRRTADVLRGSVELGD